MRIAACVAGVLLFFAGMRSCGALERIAQELKRRNDAELAADGGLRD